MKLAFRFVRLPVISISLMMMISITGSHAADERCGQLVQLNKQYRGVTLTPEQKSMKVQMVAWYRENCSRRSRRAAR